MDPRLQLEGWIIAVPPDDERTIAATPITQGPKIVQHEISLLPRVKTVIGYLNRDGTVTNNGLQVLQVTASSVVVDMQNPPSPILTSTSFSKFSAGGLTLL